MRIFHIATVADWDAARAEGRYTTSTRGRTLAEEGFIHASRGDQWQGVRERFYSDVDEPLVLLSIESDLLEAPVVEEAVGPGGETFPHVYGPITPAAVVRVIPLDAADAAPDRGEQRSFSSLFIGEMVHRMALAVIVMVLVGVGVVVGGVLDQTIGPVVGIGAGLAVGVPIAVVVHRRRERRERELSRPMA